MEVRQDIRIGNFTYQVTRKKNVGIRKFNYLLNYRLVNDFPVIRDIYFLRDINDMVFPIPETAGDGFSLDINDFNIDLISVNDVSSNTASLHYDTLRVYHPFNKSDLDALLYVETIINGIHIHLICEKFSQQVSKGDTIFNVGNESYSEYFEVEIPNIEDLISSDEHINEFMYEDDVTISDIFKPYFIIDDGNTLEARPSKVNNFESDIMTLPINVTIFPYDRIDETHKRFVVSDSYQPNSDNFYNDYKLHLSSKLGFVRNGNEEHLSLISQFYFDNIYIEKDVIETYKSLHGIREDDNGWYVTVRGKSKIDTSSNIVTDESRMYYSPFYLNGNKIDQNGSIVKVNGILCYDASKYMEDFDEETEYLHRYNEGTKTFSPIKTTIEFSTSPNFKDILFKINIQDDNQEIDSQMSNFTYPIDVLFDKWNQYPDILLCRVIWQDEVIGVSVYSNPVAITKEYYKYVTDKEYYKYIDMKVAKDINLIENVNCYLNASDASVQRAVNNNTPKVIIKPIFYKVNELQQIRIMNGINQNIGINLNDYMTKVETFKIHIGNEQFTEIARNDAFVIFNISGSLITSSIGNYHIMDEDDQYITSGKYIVI